MTDKQDGTIQLQDNSDQEPSMSDKAEQATDEAQAQVEEQPQKNADGSECHKKVNKGKD